MQPARYPLPCIAQPLGPPLDILAQPPLLDDAGVVLAHHRYRLIGPPLPHGLMLGTAFHRRRARPHMHGRLLLDSAPLVAAMVHPLRDVRPFQRRILHLGPPATPALDLPARLLVQFAGLRAQPFRADPPRRRQQMSVVVAMVALATWGVDRHVHRHPMPLADLPCEAQRKLAPRLGRQLGGQRDFIFAGDGRVLARLCLLGGVPEHGPVTGPRRGVGRHDKGVMFDALLAGVIMDEAGALVRDFDARTIGCRCRRAATG